jgi:hypothetical protein
MANNTPTQDRAAKPPPRGTNKKTHVIAKWPK